MKIGFVSLGCPKNLVDSEVMLGLARQAGHELTPDAATADVLVVNTCAFIDRAKQESIEAILEMAEHKKTGACTRLVVTGCLAERYGDELKREIPEIDAVLGTGQVPEIVKAVAPVAFYRTGLALADLKVGATSLPDSADLKVGATSLPDSADLKVGATPAFELSTCGAGLQPGQQPRGVPSYIYDADTPRVLTTPGHYAYVKIAEGCDYKCAFCIIPKLRGHYRSRSIDSIVAEAGALAARGVRELLLVSQDTTFYGVDRGERGALARLLRELNTLAGIEWIRLLYLYPTTIDDDVLSAMAECDKVCRYVDLPLQHAADAVLKRMKRPGTRATYERLLGRIRDRVPGVTLRTTFIVGFPGETERDVDELCVFLEAVAFDHVGVFTYSHEEGTSAFALGDDVPARVKAARRRRVMRLQAGIVRRAHRRRLGEPVRCLVDGPAGHELVLRGRLEGQAPEIDSAVYLTECDPSRFPPGEFIDGQVVGARGYDLLVRPVS